MPLYFFLQLQTYFKIKMLIKRKETDGFILFNQKCFIYPRYFHFSLLNKIKISEIHYFFFILSI